MESLTVILPQMPDLIKRFFLRKYVTKSNKNKKGLHKSNSRKSETSDVGFSDVADNVMLMNLPYVGIMVVVLLCWYGVGGRNTNAFRLNIRHQHPSPRSVTNIRH